MQHDLLTLAARVEALSKHLGLEARPFGDFYAVIETGDIWSCARGKWVKLRPSISYSGYQKTTLLVGEKHAEVRINRAVAEAFCGPPPASEAVARHLNDRKLDNRSCNIAWGSAKDNAIYAVKNGRCVATINSRASAHKRTADLSPTRKLHSSDVVAIRCRLSSGESGAELAREYGVSRSAISKIKTRFVMALDCVKPAALRAKAQQQMEADRG